MAPVRTKTVIPTSYDSIILFCRPQRKQFGSYQKSSKFHCHSFNAFVVTLGGEGGRGEGGGERGEGGGAQYAQCLQAQALRKCL